jgi:SAM-dependent methyltransferase
MWPVDDYRTINHANWESRVDHHVASDEYGLDRYRDLDHLSSIVRFDLPRLGSIEGLDVVHLQCHIGTDTLSLARLGATVTGLDFSESAIEAARRLSSEYGPHVEYVVADAYDAAAVLGTERFDRVYTGIGAICWLPDIDRWAETVAALLRPDGELFIREGHPVLWAIDEPRPDGLVALEFPYFEGTGVRFTDATTYVGHAGELSSPESIDFNHGLAEIFNALWSHDLEIFLFEEHDSVPWPALGDQMADIGGGEFRLIDRPERLPHSYTLRARKR